MNFLKKHKVSIGVLLVVSLLLINAFVFPFQKADPNFSDVERVFSRMQFPAEWEEIASSENRGMFGRKCPIESSSQCFHKGKIFRIPVGLETEAVKNVFLQTGCPSVAINRSEPIGGYPYVNYSCSIEGLTISGGIKEVSNENWEVSFYVRT